MSEPDYLKRAEWVRWVDSVHSSGWHALAVCQVQGAGFIDSVGFVVYEDDDRINLVQSIDTDDLTVDGVMVIPKVAILKRWTIR